MPRVTVIFDNNNYNLTLKQGFGFSCLIEFDQEKILFDLGGDKEIFLSNVQKLGIDLTKINKVILSHPHLDHLSALDSLNVLPAKTKVFLPAHFPEYLLSKIPKNLNQISPLT